MRIAHVTATFPPYYAGTGMVCYRNAQELARLGHDVTVLTAAYGPGDREAPEGVRVRRLPPAFRIGNAPLLPGLLSPERFDVIHLHYPFIFGAEMIWARARATGVPYVLTHHNDLIGDGGRGKLFEVYSRVTAPVILGGARKLAAVSLDHAANCRLGGIFRRRWSDVVEMPNGVDTEIFRPDADGASVRARLGISPDARVVLFVGAMDRAHHFKGVEYLLRALAQIEDRDVIGLLVGEGDLRPGFQAETDRLGLSERTRFIGGIPHAQLPPYYAAADVVVLPSFPPESFGMVLIEGMACGVPVIAHNIPGVRTVVKHGETGLLVEPGDTPGLAEAITRIVQDRSTRDTMGARGLAHVHERYTWPAIGRRLEALYEQVTGRAGRPAPVEAVDAGPTAVHAG
ncbi:MAG: glycosyltransferase family 4 protein [Chloroflexi bacterium]|nr:glycosyltransferase family 4 protein [Chloroflexota bacterium]